MRFTPSYRLCVFFLFFCILSFYRCRATRDRAHNNNTQRRRSVYAQGVIPLQLHRKSFNEITLIVRVCTIYIYYIIKYRFVNRAYPLPPLAAAAAAATT